jgi:alpha-L-arabinofuranosidase
MRCFAFFSKKQAVMVFLLCILSAFSSTFLFAADVNIAVNSSTVTGTIPEEIFGQNMAVWESTVNGKDLQLNKLMADSGTRFVRYPGGSYADIVMWETVGISPSTAWMRSTEDCINFANSYGAKLQVIVNFSGYWDNTQHTQAETIAKAVAEVKYMNITKKLGVKYWEIGNESGGYWEQGHTNAKDYGSRFADFYKAMKAVDPTIRIGAVSDPYDNVAQSNDTWVMRDMFAAVKAKGVIPDFLIIHTYPNVEPTGPENDGKMMTYPDTIATLTANLDAMVKKYVGAQYVGKIKYFMTEYRSSLGKNLQPLTYLDAMFTAAVHHGDGEIRVGGRQYLGYQKRDR